MTQLEDRFQKSQTVVSREIAGEVILVPIRHNLGDLENIFTLNDTAALVWKLMDSQHTLGEICEQIAEEFDVEPGQAQADVIELVAQLCEIDAVIKV